MHSQPQTPSPAGSGRRNPPVTEPIAELHTLLLLCRWQLLKHMHDVVFLFPYPSAPARWLTDSEKQARSRPCDGLVPSLFLFLFLKKHDASLLLHYLSDYISAPCVAI
ncbi:hypothetical protein SEVIR_4G143600v4 [Setaria viridis]|uniref:Uncharacterized protein n=2 Tax=Setaria TaxID=4554 RepID=A0A368QVB3_SETIT|nr:hypothetical protein SETIT_4G175300v2 [Setaria italica]TKW21780.1 hypothetical protein SEVIR_4G143600v2 [Setaria viridis]